MDRMTKHKIQMTKETQMIKLQNPKIEVSERKYDLEERTLKFAKNCVSICRLVALNTINTNFINQLTRSASSVGANYREANDTVTAKDFYHRINICRREAKESKYWLELLLYANQEFVIKIEPLIDEALQLTKIFSAISQNKK